MQPTNNATTTTVFCIPFALVLILSLIDSTYSSIYCNRGYCYTKQFDQDPSHHLYNTKTKNKQNSALNFCTDDRGHVEDCELLEVIGVSAIAEELEGVDDNNNNNNNISWKNQPKRGVCYDSAMAYTFDCNLIEVLDEGLILIEDLRAGGVIFAQPKSGFTTRHRSIKQHLEPIKTPDVMVESYSNPSQDFRANVLINLEGL